MRRRKDKGEQPSKEPTSDRDRVLQGLNGESDESETGPPEGADASAPEPVATEEAPGTGQDGPAGPDERDEPAPADPVPGEDGAAEDEKIPESGETDGSGAQPATEGQAGSEHVTEAEPSEELVSSGPLYLAYSATSNVGKIRKNNQDSGYASGNLLVVADGMGGAAAGDLASSVAIEAIAKVDRRVEGEDMLSVLADAIHRANDKIADLVAVDHTLEGMGTTVSGALFDGTQLGLAHIGDSRAYLVHDGDLEQITHDHSWVQSLIDDGKITPEEATNHPHRSLLLRVLNGQPANDPDVSIIPLSAGDRLLFCSDGLCGFVDDDMIADRLARPDRDDALDLLLHDALDAGGLDNVTIVIADVVDTPPDEVPAPLMLGAATEVDVPDTSVAPRVIDLGDGDDDTEPSARPAAPAPQVPASSADEDRYAPVSPPRLRWLRRLVAVVIVLAVVAGLGVVGYAWSRNQYCIGAADDRVAIYQGLPDKVPLLSLSRLYEVQQIQIADLPAFYQEQVRTSAITAGSLESARQSVSTLRTAAAGCIEKRRHPSPSPTSSRTPGKGSSTPGKGSSTPRTSSSPPTSQSPPATTPTSTSTPPPNGQC